MNDQARNAPHDRLQIPELARRARLRRLLWIAAALAAVGAAIVYYQRPEPVPELYRVDPAARRTIVKLVETTGSLDVRSRVEVPAPIPGRLTAIRVEAGEHVQSGQVLATLDTRAAQLEVRGARAGLGAASGRMQQARAAHALAKQAAARAERLHERGLSSDQELAAARGDLARAQAMLDAARAERKLAAEQVESAELAHSLGRITAPAAGVVLRAPDRLGAAVGPESGPLFVLGEPLETMRIEALVGETEIALIEPGLDAEVLVQALAGRSFRARVERVGIDPVREGGVVQYPVFLRVESPTRELLPGMSARVQMEVARAADALSVHEAALRFHPEGAAPVAARSRVYLRTGEHGHQLEAIRVEPGVSDGVYTAVEPAEPGALSVGDPVVIGQLRGGTDGRKPNVSLGGK